MKRLFALLTLFAFSLPSRAVHAQTDAVGTVAATFTFAPSKVVADPNRDLVYATVPADNTLRIIDTTTLQEIFPVTEADGSQGRIVVGSIPVDIALSSDGSMLYTANAGSTLQAISAIDLDSLSLIANYPLPGPGLAIAGGLNNSIYVLSFVNVSMPGTTTTTAISPVYEVDGNTGQVGQPVLGSDTTNVVMYDLIQSSADRNTLFAASTDVGLVAVDISGNGGQPPGNPLIGKNAVGIYPSNTIPNPDPDLDPITYLAVPDPSGDGGGTPLTTLLFSEADPGSYYGTLSDAATPGPLTYTLDDSLVYQMRFDSTNGLVLVVFDTATFIEDDNVTLPEKGLSLSAAGVNSISLDRTGSLLFVAGSESNAINATGQLLVVTTGTGTLNPFQPPTFATTSLPNGVVGQAYRATVLASSRDGSTVTFGAADLPPGLSIGSTTGVISGTPIRTGVYPVEISATNTFGTTTTTLSITITGTSVFPPVINSASSATASIGVPYAYQITATNNPTSYGATGLPTGFSFNAVTGILTGTPVTAGSFVISLTASNLAGTGSGTLLLTVAPIPTPVINSPATSTGTVGAAFSYQISASNSPSSFAASGLPPGLSVNTTNGLISGTPTQAGTFTAMLSATNLSATGTATLTVTIAPNVPTVNIMTTVATVTAGTTDHAAFTISRTGDLTQKLTVAYVVRGSAANGTDYVMLSGTKKIKAGRNSATIQVTPAGSGSTTESKLIKLNLQPAVTYQVGPLNSAKVRILPP